MPEQQTRDVVLRATFGDCCNGLVRLVDDVQRFGLRLRTLVLACADDEAAVATIGLSIPRNADADFIAMRLARHPSVASIEVQRECSAPQTLLQSSLLQTAVDHETVLKLDRSVGHILATGANS